MVKTFLSMLCAIINVGCANTMYSTSDQIINSTYKRSVYFSVNAGLPESSSEFLKYADRTIPVVVHAHGCYGIFSSDMVTKSFYSDEMKYHVVMPDFLARPGAKPSCDLGSSNTGYVETINPARQEARRMEVDSQIKWLKEHGFKNIFVSGRSEGGKVVQHIKQHVNGVIVFNMDCKSREFWKPNKNNKYLFVYSTQDSWITGNRNYSTVKCTTVFNKNMVTEIISTTIQDHEPFTDPRWKPAIIKMFNSNIR